MQQGSVIHHFHCNNSPYRIVISSLASAVSKYATARFFCSHEIYLATLDILPIYEPSQEVGAYVETHFHMPNHDCERVSLWIKFKTLKCTFTMKAEITC